MTRCPPLIVTLTLITGLALGVGRAPGATLPAAPGYVLTDLGSLGGSPAVPVAINVKGDVAGYSTTAAGEIHAFLLPVNGSMKDLGTLGGAASYGTSLNNRGDVAGYSSTTAEQVHAFVVLDGQMIDLGVLGGVASNAVGINDLRQVLTDSSDSQGDMKSSLWQNGQIVPLGTLGGSSTSGAGLNNLGQVVGSSLTADGANHGFGYDPTTPQLIDLGDIGAKGTLTHVNELGQAVGIRTTAFGARIAFGADVTATHPLADKLVRRGFSGTEAYWINNAGVTVGAGELSAGPGTNAGVWTADGQFMNLNQALLPNSGWILQSANAINDAGVIVGAAQPPGGVPIAYMLIALGPDLPAEKALADANSLDPAIAAVQKGSDAAAKAAAASALATALTDLQQARLLLMPGAREATVSGIGTSQASHLLSSAGNLLSIPDPGSFLSSADRDGAVAIITAAQKSLQ